MENYHDTIELDKASDKIYDALTDEIQKWWTEMFEGSAIQKGDTFTVRFGESVFKTMKVEELTINQRVVWYVESSLIAIPDLKNQTEWVGTTIVWEMVNKGSGSQLSLEHIGLNPTIECYNICTNGWKQFTNSLKLHVESGNGSPFKA